MSHFSVLVVGLATALEAQLQPFHEFECTGIDDQYVQEIDKTADALETFERATTTRFRAPDGGLHSPYGEDGNYRDEFSVPAEGILNRSRREKRLPEGWTEVEVPAKGTEDPGEWIVGYYGGAVLRPGETPTEAHKYGRVEVDADGNILRVIDRTNPNKQWDWWRIGGRWGGFFKLKAGAVGVLGKRSGSFDEPKDQRGPEYADQARKGDIDFEGMRNDAAAKAAESWEKIRGIVGDMEGFVTWEKMREEVHPGNVEAARTAYDAQPQKTALAAAAKAESEANPGKGSDLFWVELDPYVLSLEQYKQRARDAAGRTFAVLKDGKWHERGSMGWWGCVGDDKGEEQWNAEFVKLIDGLSDDTVLTVVDCHI